MNPLSFYYCAAGLLLYD